MVILFRKRLLPKINSIEETIEKQIYEIRKKKQKIKTQSQNISHLQSQLAQRIKIYNSVSYSTSAEEKYKKKFSIKIQKNQLSTRISKMNEVVKKIKHLERIVYNKQKELQKVWEGVKLLVLGEVVPKQIIQRVYKIKKLDLEYKSVNNITIKIRTNNFFNRKRFTNDDTLKMNNQSD